MADQLKYLIERNINEYSFNVSDEKFLNDVKEKEYCQ